MRSAGESQGSRFSSYFRQDCIQCRGDSHRDVECLWRQDCDTAVGASLACYHGENAMRVTIFPLSIHVADGDPEV